MANVAIEYRDLWTMAAQAEKYQNASTLASIYDQMARIMEGQNFDTFCEFMAYAPARIVAVGAVAEVRRADLWRAWLPKADLTSLSIRRVKALYLEMPPMIGALVVLTWAAQVNLYEYAAQELVGLAKVLPDYVRKELQSEYNRQGQKLLGKG